MANGTSPSIVYWLGNNLYLNVTNRCSNDCIFCLRNFKDGVGGFKLKLKEDPAVSKILSDLQEVINKRNWAEVVFCGFGEPTMRLDCILEAARWVARYYGKATSIRVDTNGHGYLLNKGRDVIRELQEAGVEKLSVSLNAPDRETYNIICRPEFSDAFENVLEFIDKARRKMDIEVTAVAVPEADIRKVETLANKIGVKLRIREYIPPLL